jgi:NAD(P)-dependent dehydrogenase (short-subunit alcohol dehydrogenase family)
MMKCFCLGIGLALCRKLYEQGAILYALDVSQEALSTLAKECSGIVPLCVNLLDWEETRKVVESISGESSNLFNSCNICNYLVN